MRKMILFLLSVCGLLVTGQVFAYEWEFDCWPKRVEFDNPYLDEPRCELSVQIDYEFDRLTKELLEREFLRSAAKMRDYLKADKGGLAIELRRITNEQTSPADLAKRANDLYREKYEEIQREIEQHGQDVLRTVKETDAALEELDVYTLVKTNAIKTSAKMLTASAKGAVAGGLAGAAAAAGAVLTLEAIKTAGQALEAVWKKYQVQAALLASSMEEFMALAAQAEDVDEMSRDDYLAYLRKMNDKDKTMIRAYALSRPELNNFIVGLEDLLDRQDELKGHIGDLENADQSEDIDDLIADFENSLGDIETTTGELISNMDEMALMGIMEDIERAHVDARNFIDSRDPADLQAISRWHKRWRERFRQFARAHKASRGDYSVTVRRAGTMADYERLRDEARAKGLMN